MKEALIKIAAELVTAQNLVRLYHICETQKTVDTKKLLRIVGAIHDRQKDTAVALRQIAKAKEGRG